jgi:D-tyrosyl-tRNA(Tyr) deacylase
MMIALVQRTARASVSIGGVEVARIERGMLALIGIASFDNAERGRQLLKKLLAYRMFPDDGGKMNRNLRQIDGALLLVPQFTLLADTNKGTRPGFSLGAAPATAKPLFDGLVEGARVLHPRVAAGVFGADMQVELVNDGPVTFWLEC